MTDGGTAEADPDDEATAAVERERVVRRVRERARAIRDREVRRALDRLEAAGGHTEHHCETVRALGESLTASLVAPAVESLRDADDEATLRTAVDLFEE